MSSKMDPKGQDSEQLWWFVTESAEDSKYYQRSKLLSEVRRKNPKISDILSLLRLKGMPEDYNFWIHSPSMSAAVQLLKDTAINVIWTLYCRDDPTVTIIVRPASDHSPNTSTAPSAKSSLAERRKASGRRTVSEVFTRPDPRHVSQHFDPVTQEPLKDLAESDKVQIDFGGGKYETFSKDYLIGMSFHFCLRGTCRNGDERIGEESGFPLLSMRRKVGVREDEAPYTLQLGLHVLFATVSFSFLPIQI